MLGHEFYNGSIRKYISVFGSLFNNIYISRENSEGIVAQTLKVPITYGPKDKWLAREAQDPTLLKDVAITLPRMSFELTEMFYDGSRKLNSKRIRIGKQDNSFVSVYNPVPYNFNFTLSIMVKNIEDGTRIVEQILPYFIPEFTPTVEIIPGLHTSDVPIILRDISMQDTYEGDFISRRAIIWTLNFTLKGELFGSVKQTNLIKNIDVNMFFSGEEAIIQNTNVRPGLTESGQPTSNVETSIPYRKIKPDDDYGYIITQTDTI